MPRQKGFTQSEETKRKISESLKGHISFSTPEGIQKMTLSRRANPNRSRHWLGKKFSTEHRLAVSEGQKQRFANGVHPRGMLGKTHNSETRKKISIGHIGKGHPGLMGSENPMWIADRSKIVGRQNRNNPVYKQWRMNVWLRDNFKCKIADANCVGRIEAHHILGWKLYPELRYELNNGITLCHAHHPRKRAEEKRLEPVFQALVSVSKEQ